MSRAAAGAAAWIATVVIVGAVLMVAVLGLQALQAPRPALALHTQGQVVAIRGNSAFALKIPGQSGEVWFDVVPSSHLSMDHLRRHMGEHATTDVTYKIEGAHTYVAWIAD